MSASSSKESANVCQGIVGDKCDVTQPFPTTQSFMRLAQYSFDHHSTNLLLVSLPTSPPSSSPSLDVGDGVLDTSVLEEADTELSFLSPFTLLFFTCFAARSSVSRLPVPNLLHGLPGRLLCLLTWKMRQMSLWWFFLCSESTAFSSRTVQLGEKSGEWKKPEKRSSAPLSAGGPTLK